VRHPVEFPLLHQRPTAFRTVHLPSPHPAHPTPRFTLHPKLSAPPPASPRAPLYPAPQAIRPAFPRSLAPRAAPHHHRRRPLDAAARAPTQTVLAPAGRKVTFRWVFYNADYVKWLLASLAPPLGLTACAPYGLHNLGPL